MSKTVSNDFDAYKLLQVDPQADDIVLDAAFQALEHRYGSDNGGGDAQRMADIKRAYDLLRTPVRRRRYDREHRLTPVGPGTASVDPASTNEVDENSALNLAPTSRGYESVKGQRQLPSANVIDFGRYRGWVLKDLAKHDPDYLRWLARSSGGAQYRKLIHQLLPNESDPEPRKVTPRHRG